MSVDSSVPMPAGEEQRLAVLREYAVLDTPPERTFDDIAFEAAALCEAPVGLVSLVDAERVWIKAAYGFERGETPREVAFCSHAICQPEPLVVADTLSDERFADNVLVTAEPFLRAYASAPILVGDVRIGTVAVVDTQARAFDDDQLEALQALARLASDQFELRARGAHLSQTLERLRTLEGLLPICSECRSVRDDDGQWLQLDHYLGAHTGALVSHGLCPECLPRYLPAGGSPSPDS